MAAGKPPAAPPTHCELDQLAFCRNAANLLIAVPDRATPDVAPRIDPDASPYTTDQGVLAVPLWPFRALSAMRAGADPATALLLLAGTAVADFAVHEALETYQKVSGRPVWDPHDSPYELTPCVGSQAARRLPLALRASSSARCCSG
ncbi:hypothetical protein AB0C28_50995 [Nonomuraea sp. NPDC048892]|uniref:hypothetical protein n=1 Tax=Nonomuraea sp. NPDC048892 TaxID=3154624 RepID=UPI003404EF4C